MPNAFVSDPQMYTTISAGAVNTPFYDTAVGGYTINDCDAADTALADPRVSPPAVNVISIWAGTNDIGNLSHTSAQLQTDLITYVANRRAAGWNKILCYTLLPRDGAPCGNSFFNTQSATFNTWLRANWATYFDALVDVAADPIMGNPANLSDGIYYADNTHPAAAGDARIATLVTSALRLFL